MKQKLRNNGPLAPLSLAALTAALWPLGVFAQTTQDIRIVTYNTQDDVNPPTPSSALPYIETVIEGIGQQKYTGDGILQLPDIIALQETTSNSVTVVPIQMALNTYYGSNIFATSTYQATTSDGVTGGGGPNGLVYNQNTMNLMASVGVGTPESGTVGPGFGEFRQVVRYEFQPIADKGTNNGVFYVYDSHYKSGSAGTSDDNSTDGALRNGEAIIVRNDEAANLPANAAVLYVGDYNLGGSTEAMYQTLTAPNAPSGLNPGQGQAFDPLNAPLPNNNNEPSYNVTWDKNSAYQGILTESDSDLRYRDDLETMTSNVYYDTPGNLNLIANSYHAFGNNGGTAVFGNVNSGSNTALNDIIGNGPLAPSTVLAAMNTSIGSDHLPVVADYSLVLPTQNLTWDNAGATSINDGLTWDVNHYLNWNSGSNSSTYTEGSTVTFNDTNNNKYAVTLNTTVSPASVTVNNSLGNYTISGTGTIGGNGSLTKTGGDTLTLSTANAYTGGTNINGGVLNVGSSGAIGTAGVISFGGGTLQYSSSNTTDYSSRVSSAANQAYNIDTNGRSVIWASALTSSGGSLTKLGTGSLSLSGPNTYSGTTTVSAGTLIAGASNSLSPNSAVTVASTATLDVSGFANQVPGLTVSSGGRLILGIGNVLTDTGAASFAGTLNILGTPSGSPVELMSYTSDSGTFTAVTPEAGYNLVYASNELELVLNGPANLTWTNAHGNNLWDATNSANWNTGTSTVIFHQQDNVTFDDNNPSNTPANYAVTLNSLVSPGSVTANNSQGDYTISGSGTIGGTGSLTKSGTGMLTLSTANNYTGGTNVTNGRLMIAQAGSNATFDGGGNLATANTLTALPTGSLTVSGNGIVQLADGVTNQTFVTPGAASSVVTSNINLTSLSLAGNGTLDIGNNRIIIDYTTGNDPIASIAQWIANGFVNGESAGTGAAIISSDIASDDLASGFSYGLGYADGADGAIAGLPSGEIEIMFTLLGDANLDGTVNSEDFTPFSNNLNGSDRSWDQGDFNYDGTVNSEDFTPFSHDLNQPAVLAASETGALLSPLAASNSLINVPEPASTGLLAVGLVSVLARRRRKAKA